MNTHQLAIQPRYSAYVDFFTIRSDWYPLPESLITDLKNCDGYLLGTSFAEQNFPFILQTALTISSQTLAPYNNAYHNEQHLGEVVANLQKILEHASWAQRMPSFMIQSALIAAAFHDAAHPGSTFRANATKQLAYPELTAYSNEQVSAVIADQFAQSMDLGLLNRLLITRCIWATTFGVIHIKPEHCLERALVSADVAPCEDFIEWVKRGASVHFLEILTGSKLKTYMDFLITQQSFLRHIRSHMIPEAVSLWGHVLDSHESKMESLLLGHSKELQKEVLLILNPYLEQ